MFAVGVPGVGHPTFHARRHGRGLGAAASHTSKQPAVAAAEVFQALFPEPNAAVGKDSEADEVDTVAAPNEPVFIGMNLQFEAGQPLPRLFAHLAELVPRLAEKETIVHGANVAAGPQHVGHEMIEGVVHHVGKELACKVANGKAPPTIRPHS